MYIYFTIRGLILADPLLDRQIPYLELGPFSNGENANISVKPIIGVQKTKSLEYFQV